MTGVWFLYEKMLTQRIFLISWARAEEMFYVGVKALARGIVAQE